MASEEVKKKWGTIFMGDREASVEQLSAMQESLQRERRARERSEDYMERVRARAASRAKEILGAAYAERQKVLDEARGEAQEQKKKILADCNQLKAEAERAQNQARAELAKAEEERREAQALLSAAHEEGYKAGMDQAREELHEFRLELGQALGQLLRALEWRQKEILKDWRDDLVELVQCAAQAGAGYVLSKEHNSIMRGLVFQALDLLESRRSISIKVNPDDEPQVSGLFRAARERYPELGQWIVTGDEKIERGGLVAESGSGSADLKRENFRSMVEDVLSHLALPEGKGESGYDEMIREIVEREASRIASLTPELDMPVLEPDHEPEAPDAAMDEPMSAELSGSADEEEPLEGALPPEDKPEEINPEPHMEPEIERDNAALASGPLEEELFEDFQAESVFEEEAPAPVSVPEDVNSSDPALAALEEELFPLEGEDAASDSLGERKEAKEEELKLEPETLAQGGFL